ncbi:zinc-dependent alcohol dehydrogenase family protein [Candidimonas nitroreducens]|uniref:Quinone oxidoreductase n=1 Tax=Candidimonas nitroreducens TaxID=683354 RepID=A0A225MQZ3_9BURK|nr:zinc-dependent alcohol dehydrogenase family protein [Candidimonas nitroreducens]OWT63666.1 quinone oxidoreductase [Candidimonas nitroreducens]
MKVQQIHEFGAPDVFKIAEVEKSEPGSDQIRVRQMATSVNPVDIKIRQMGPSFAPALPPVLGCDVAGVVDAVGKNVSRFRTGDEVYGCAAGVIGRGGSYGEYVVVDAELMANKPRTLGWRETAALPLVTITAWEALVDRCHVKPGDHVLIHGGAGGVGHIAIQIAKAQGAYVATTVSTDEKAEIARRCGADEIIRYRDELVADYVKRLTDGRGFDVVFDAAGGSDIAKSFEAARVRGQVATITTAFTADLSPMHGKSLTLNAVLMLATMLRGASPEHNGEILTKAAVLADAKRLKPVLDEQRFGLSDVGAAHTRLESGNAVGKVVVDIADGLDNA